MNSADKYIVSRQKLVDGLIFGKLRLLQLEETGVETCGIIQVLGVGSLLHGAHKKR